MPYKDPTNYPLITYAWVLILATWGGAVSFLQKHREGLVRPFNLTELIGDLMTSAFTGLITFWLCELSETPPLLAAALIGVSGHMGSRSLYHLEHWLTTKFTHADVKGKE